ncbi:MAG: sulfite exporter TauE/SafE family protein [Vicingaceae bacterium]
MSIDLHWTFYILLALASFIYSSVGHGGASAYLALLALFGADMLIMKPIALTLNLFVAGTSFIIFQRSGYFSWNRCYPFLITSVPAAFIGGYYSLDSDIYKVILGLFMFFSVIRLMGWVGKERNEKKDASIILSLLIGAVIGLISGMLGIGGGIILSPLILMLAWANMKETAAISSIFILINSFAGLLGYLTAGSTLPSHLLFLIPLVLTGAWFGAKMGSLKLSNKRLEKLLAAVLFTAGVKLVFL